LYLKRIAGFIISTLYKTVMINRKNTDLLNTRQSRMSMCSACNRQYQGPLSAFGSFARSGTHKANASDAVANMNRRGAHFTHAGTPALLVQHATWQVITGNNRQFSDNVKLT